MQHYNSQPAEAPTGVENLYAYQKGVQVEISLGNAIREIEKGMGTEGLHCSLYSNPQKVSSQFLHYALVPALELLILPQTSR